MVRELYFDAHNKVVVNTDSHNGRNSKIITTFIWILILATLFHRATNQLGHSVLALTLLGETY